MKFRFFQRLLFASVLSLVLVVPAGPASVFWKRKEAKNKPKGPILVSETADYRVLFYPTKETRINNDPSLVRKEKEREVAYKFSHLAVDRRLFGESRWIELQFKDGEGAILETDKIAWEDLAGDHEHYGVIWVPDAQASKLVSTEVEPRLEEEEVRPEGEGKAESAKQEEEKELDLETQIKRALKIPEEETAPVETSVKPQKSEPPKRPPMEIVGGIQNEAVTASLKDFEEKKATDISLPPPVPGTAPSTKEKSE